MQSIKAGLILDSLTLPRWQFEALKSALELKSFKLDLILVCENTKNKKKIFTHFLYYLLRVLVMRPKSWEKISILDLLEDPEIVHFQSEYEGSWQKLPNQVLERINSENFGFLIKFGMGLLRVPKEINLPHGIFSFHHGDPESYRGRPSGFYELMDSALYTGAVVQRISNKLDAGEILAFGKFKIFPYSYKKTLESLFVGSQCLLSKAIQNSLSGKLVVRSVNGRNYSLPSNFKVIIWGIKVIHRKFHRWIYGLFFEKDWRVATKSENLKFGEFQIQDFKALKNPPNYRFLADPFYDPSDDSIFLEAMNSSSGKGEILKIIPDSQLVKKIGLNREGKHLSYPYTWKENGISYLLPEMASHDSPRLFEISDSDDLKELKIKGLDGERIIDPTLCKYLGKFWLFGAKPGKVDQLFLWFSEQLTGPYKPHLLNPILLDPMGARPGGRIIEKEGSLYRFGQDNRGDYGDGIICFKITEISEVEYKEKPLGRISVKDFKGPHTIDIKDNEILFDIYKDKFNPLAFVNRIKNKI